MRGARGHLRTADGDGLAASPGTRRTVFTVGHSTRSIESLLGVLEQAGVELLVDVRTVPRSRRHPQFERGALAASLLEHGVDYLHEPALGGFRRPRPDSPNDGWEQPAFRGYADHMAGEEFAQGLGRLEAAAEQQATCMMCAEAQWWRCHRRLISDALTVHGRQVLHLGLRPQPVEHELTPFAQVGRDGTLTYPSAQQKLAGFES